MVVYRLSACIFFSILCAGNTYNYLTNQKHPILSLAYLLIVTVFVTCMICRLVPDNHFLTCLRPYGRKIRAQDSFKRGEGKRAMIGPAQ